VATEAEMRGRLLTVFYELRHSNDGWVPASDTNLADMESVNLQTVDTVCRHLAEAGLIEWKPLSSEGLVAGMARIKGHGIDVIERKASPNINVTLPGATPRDKVENLVPDSQTWEAAAQIARRQRGLSAAVESTLGVTAPPPPPIAPSGSISQQVTVETNVIRATIPIIPTLYPSEPASGAIVVQNFLSINVGSPEYSKFVEKVDELISELRQSNTISGEVREKLVAEITAGMVILGSPKPDPKLIDLLLKRPLTYVVDKAVGTVVSTLAATALMALLKMMGIL
jgi:hypothetical protein